MSSLLQQIRGHYLDVNCADGRFGLVDEFFTTNEARAGRKDQSCGRAKVGRVPGGDHPAGRGREAQRLRRDSPKPSSYARTWPSGMVAASVRPGNRKGIAEHGTKLDLCPFGSAESSTFLRRFSAPANLAEEFWKEQRKRGVVRNRRPPIFPDFPRLHPPKKGTSRAKSLFQKVWRHVFNVSICRVFSFAGTLETCRHKPSGTDSKGCECPFRFEALLARFVAMNSQPFLGIDFGTCNSSMAWFNPKTGQAEIL